MNCTLHFSTLESTPSVSFHDQSLEVFRATRVDQEQKGHIYLYVCKNSDGSPSVTGFVVQEDGSLKEDVSSKDYLRLTSRSDMASVFNSISTPRKAATCRVNGRRGGRPKVRKESSNDQ